MNGRLNSGKNYSVNMPNAGFAEVEESFFALHTCCRDDGDVFAPIPLPTRVPFILFPTIQEKRCQHVKGMKSVMHSIFFDTSLHYEWGDSFITRSDLMPYFLYDARNPVRNFGFKEEQFYRVSKIHLFLCYYFEV